METLTLSLGSAMLMGLAFGAGPCNVTCLPYLGPVFLGNESNWSRRLHTIVPFSLGRMTGYALLGAVAGSAGYAATQWFEDGVAGIVLGLAAIILGIMLIIRAGKEQTCQVATVPDEQTIHLLPPRRTMMPLSLFMMGVGMALNPCAPLATVLLAAAVTNEMSHGLILGLSFGAGAVIIPGIFFGVLVAHFGEQVRHYLSAWRVKLERMAGGLLLLVGLMTAVGWIKP